MAAVATAEEQLGEAPQGEPMLNPWCVSAQGWGSASKMNSQIKAYLRVCLDHRPPVNIPRNNFVVTHLASIWKGCQHVMRGV